MGDSARPARHREVELKFDVPLGAACPDFVGIPGVTRIATPVRLSLVADYFDTPAHDLAANLVTLATAHPAKFRDAVERATGVRPPLPSRAGDLFGREERYATLPATFEAVTAYVAEHATPRA